MYTKHPSLSHMHTYQQDLPKRILTHQIGICRTRSLVQSPAQSQCYLHLHSHRSCHQHGVCDLLRHASSNEVAESSEKSIKAMIQSMTYRVHMYAQRRDPSDNA